MNVIDAFWEKRNLGVSCKEIEIEKNDSLEDIQRSYEENFDSQYLVVKVPPQRLDIMTFLQEKGCVFVETLFYLSTDLNKLQIPSSFEPIIKKCSWQKMDDTDFEVLLHEMTKTLFSTDRVFLDPFFSHEQAASRYINWLKDLYQKEIIPYKVLYDGSVIGFFVNKIISETTLDGILVGTYSDYKETGLGYCVQVENCIAAREWGYKKIIGRASSNNMSTLRVVGDYGTKIKKIRYIFIKHNS